MIYWLVSPKTSRKFVRLSTIPSAEPKKPHPMYVPAIPYKSVLFNPASMKVKPIIADRIAHIFRLFLLTFTILPLCEKRSDSYVSVYCSTTY